MIYLSGNSRLGSNSFSFSFSWIKVKILLRSRKYVKRKMTEGEQTCLRQAGLPSAGRPSNLPPAGRPSNPQTLKPSNLQTLKPASGRQALKPSNPQTCLRQARQSGIQTCQPPVPTKHFAFFRKLSHDFLVSRMRIGFLM